VPCDLAAARASGAVWRPTPLWQRVFAQTSMVWCKVRGQEASGRAWPISDFVEPLAGQWEAKANGTRARTCFTLPFHATHHPPVLTDADQRRFDSLIVRLAPKERVRCDVLARHPALPHERRPRLDGKQRRHVAEFQGQCLALLARHAPAVNIPRPAKCGLAGPPHRNNCACLWLSVRAKTAAECATAPQPRTRRCGTGWRSGCPCIGLGVASHAARHHPRLLRPHLGRTASQSLVAPNRPSFQRYSRFVNPSYGRAV
jgi:hypothetical protein